jgi:hypothetical protein
VSHAQPQESGTLIQTDVIVKDQQAFGTDSNVSAHKTLLDLNVSHAQPQEDGTSMLTNVFAHHQPQSGTELNASAQLEPMDPIVFHAQLQDSGMEMNVFAQKRESGMVKIAFVKLVSLVQTVLAVQLNNIGMKDLKLVSAQVHLFGTANIAFAHNHTS